MNKTKAGAKSAKNAKTSQNKAKAQKSSPENCD